MATFTVSRSGSIAASPEKIANIISDYNHWAAWSPWMILEEGINITVTEGGKAFSWEGKRTGSGEMKVLNESPQRIDMHLAFLKPWKSTSKVWFDLKPEGDQTRLTWSMEGSLPFFLFWMKKMMTAYIGMDYVRGLTMLKDYVETGSVPTKLDFKGIEDFKGCHYVGIRSACDLDVIQSKMSEDFRRLELWVNENRSLVTAPPFSIYHKWDVVKRKVEYTGAYPVSQAVTGLPSGLISGAIPATKVNTIVHTGAYRHLGNAWSAQYNMHQSKVFKASKKIHPFEVYVSMPGNIPEQDVVTAIHFPVA